MIQALRRQLLRLKDENESGQAMVEFVLVFPVQLFFTLAIIQFGLILNAHLVVQQAAFQGARSAAVSDVEGGTRADENAHRTVARTVAVLTTGGDEINGGAPPADGELEWKAKDGRYGYSKERENEAYALLEKPIVDHKRDKGYVSCDVTYNYVMWIPVANHFFATITDENRAASNRSVSGKRRTTFKIRRVGFIATPWTMEPE